MGEKERKAEEGAEAIDDSRLTDTSDDPHPDASGSGGARPMEAEAAAAPIVLPQEVPRSSTRDVETAIDEAMADGEKKDVGSLNSSRDGHR